MTLTADKLNGQGGMRRDARVRKVDTESRTVEVAFATATPVGRWFGDEVLRIDAESIRLNRLDDGAAVLVNHDWDDQVGVVDQVRIDRDGAARAVLRFGRTGRSADIFTDIVDGIRKHVSVGYVVHKIEIAQREGQPDLVTVTDWEPYEISIVAVPADPAAGVGRSAKGANAMPTPTDTAPHQDNAASIRAMLEVGQAYDCLEMASSAIREGRTLAQLEESIRLDYDRRGSVGRRLENQWEPIGMTRSDVGQFSLMKLVRYLENPDARTREAAAFELECSSAFAQRTGRATDGILIPTDVLLDRNFGRRDLATGTPAGGGALVAVEHDAANFIDLLRAQTAVIAAGAQVIQGLVGNLAMPRLAGGASVEWVPEAGAPVESQPVFDTVSVTPHTLAGAVPISRRLLMQSTPDAERVVRNDLARAVALTIDSAALGYETAADAPGGLRPLIATGALEWTADDFPTFGEIIELETRVAEAHADLNMASYIFGSRLSGHLKRTPITAGHPRMIEEDGQVNGYMRHRSNLVPAPDVFFGNWADMILGFWSGLDLRADTATLAASDGLVLRAFQDLDIAIRHPASFALGTNAPGS